MDLSPIKIAIVLVAGLFAGFINALAGGGSFLTLAALEFAGLPAAMANGTNRIAVIAQNIAAVAGFRSKGVGDWKYSLQLAVPTVIGSIIGAYVVIDLPEQLFHRILGVAMLIMLFTLVFNTNKWLASRKWESTPARRILGYALFAAIGFYGGAIQAGVGFFLIAALVVFAGQDLVHANSHKVFIVGIFTIVAFVMFLLRGQVNWILGLILAIGNSVGAWIASRLAVQKGEKFVRVVLGAMLVFLTLQYFGIIPSF